MCTDLLCNILPLFVIFCLCYSSLLTFTRMHEQMADDWNNSDDEEGTHCREWKRVEDSLGKQGYRQGLETSQEETMQDGFNEGFKRALKMAFAAGHLQGGICASLTWTPAGQEALNDGDNTLVEKRDSLQNVNNDVTSLVSKIPSLLVEKETFSCGTSSAQECSCSVLESVSSPIANFSDYWNQLRTLHCKAERADEHIDINSYL